MVGTLDLFLLITALHLPCTLCDGLVGLMVAPAACVSKFMVDYVHLLVQLFPVLSYLFLFTHLCLFITGL